MGFLKKSKSRKGGHLEHVVSDSENGVASESPLEISCALVSISNSNSGSNSTNNKRNPFRLMNGFSSNSKSSSSSSPSKHHGCSSSCAAPSSPTTSMDHPQIMIKQQESTETANESISIKSLSTSPGGIVTPRRTSSRLSTSNVDKQTKTPSLDLLQSYIFDLSATDPVAPPGTSSSSGSSNGKGSNRRAGSTTGTSSSRTSEQTAAATLALRNLFSLSEHSHPNCDENRLRLVQSENINGKLVPALLHFLHRRCEPGSQEQYLALLVLNNLSVPPENKRAIALDCGGAQLLCRMLCLDPSCHLVAIILVNLTFCGHDLRKELCDDESGTELVEALGFALQIATSYSKHGTHILMKLPNIFYIDRVSPKEMMTNIQYYKPFNEGALYAPPSEQLFPETARWCVSAIKNLTRPDNSVLMDDVFITHLINCGIVSVLLDIVSVTAADSISSSSSSMFHNDDNRNTILSPSRSSSISDFSNKPSRWETNTLQDVALFAILHVAMSSPSILIQSTILSNIIPTLSSIADYGITSGDALRNGGMGPKGMSYQAKLIQQFQCLKARMALSYLVGGAGHFGQKRSSGITPADESVLMVMADEVKQLVELLANTLADRGKPGVGGYSAQAFTLKSVLYAIRCLLVTMTNQRTFASAGGVKLNALLVRCVARHSLQHDFETVDVSSAEYASFSLYLLSNFGFQKPFLPASMMEHQLTEKVFTSYLHTEDITPAGQHASDQLLLRLKNLMVDKSASSTVATASGFEPSDFELGQEIEEKSAVIIVNERETGAIPHDDIFSRPIVRIRPARSGEKPSSSSSRKTEFQNALSAAQILSFGTNSRIRDLDNINDDIEIANNLVKCANRSTSNNENEHAIMYNYRWIWKTNLPPTSSAASTTPPQVGGAIPLHRAGSLSSYASSHSVASESKASAAAMSLNSRGTAGSHATSGSQRSRNSRIERLSSKRSEIVKTPSILSNGSRRTAGGTLLPRSIPEEEQSLSNNSKRGRSRTPRSTLTAADDAESESIGIETSLINVKDDDGDVPQSEHPLVHNVTVHQQTLVVDESCTNCDATAQSDHSSLASYPEDALPQQSILIKHRTTSTDNEPVTMFNFFRCGVP